MSANPLRLLDAARGGRRDWRAVVQRLLAEGKLAPRDYAKTLHEGGGPADWAFALFLFFGAAQLIAGAIYFFAYNWRDLSDIAKIALPQIGLVLGFLVYLAAPPRSPVATTGAVFATVMIGVSMGVVGQVYQLGADPWTLFALWAAFALPLAFVARSDALVAVWFLIATAAYALYAEEELRPRLSDHAVAALYGALAFAVLMAREFASTPPRWLRWLLVAFAAGAVTIASVDEAFADWFFADGAVATLALLALSALLLAAYRLWRPDRPARTLALFAPAVLVGAVGLRAIWRMKTEGAGAFAFEALLSALWIVFVTALLALALRGKERT
jgi:uncharacterized membrane protein